MILFKWTMILFLALVMSCGGGGGSNGTTEQSQDVESSGNKAYYVSSKNDCRENSPCYLTIIEALEASLQNYIANESIDRILVYPGTYTGAFDLPVILLWHPVEIISVDGATETIISGVDNGQCAEVVDPGYVLIQGFTFTSCGFDSIFINEQSAIYSNSYYDMDLYIVENIFEGNGDFFGGGHPIHINPYFVNYENINVTIEKNIFRNNWGGINIELTQSEIDSPLPSNFVIANNLIYDNHEVSNTNTYCASLCLRATEHKVVIESNINVDILNNTIINNNSSGIDIQQFSSAVHVKNNIVYGNNLNFPQIYWIGTDPSEPPGTYPPAVIENNLIQQNQSDPQLITNNNYYGVPVFKNYALGDFSLEGNSDGIDIGTMDMRVLLQDDFQSQERVLDGDADGTATIDVGAIEYSMQP